MHEAGGFERETGRKRFWGHELRRWGWATGGARNEWFSAAMDLGRRGRFPGWAQGVAGEGVGDGRRGTLGELSRYCRDDNCHGATLKLS
jgi:hypothetical protein